MANCKYRELKKTIQLLQSNQLSNDSIQELINSYRNIHTPKELLDAFIKYCYHLDYISSQVHAKELLKDIDKNLSQSEILLIDT